MTPTELNILADKVKTTWTAYQTLRTAAAAYTSTTSQATRDANAAKQVIAYAAWKDAAVIYINAKAPTGTVPLLFY